MYKFRLITLLALWGTLIIITAGCGKSDKPVVPDQTSAVATAIFKNGGDAYYSFTYNSSSQLTGFTFRADLKLPNETYTYTGSTLSAVTTATQKTVFTYNATGQVTKAETRTIATNHLETVRQYTYNGAGKVSTIDRLQTISPLSETLTLALTYTYQYDAQGLITKVTDRDRRTDTDAGEWQINGYTAAIKFHPLIIGKIIFGDDFDAVVLATLPKLPISVHYQKLNNPTPYFFTDTYDYVFVGSAIASIKQSTTVTQNGTENTYTPAPFVFKY